MMILTVVWRRKSKIRVVLANVLAKYKGGLGKRRTRETS